MNIDRKHSCEGTTKENIRIVKTVSVKAWRCPGCQHVQIAKKSGNHTAECSRCETIVEVEN